MEILTAKLDSLGLKPMSPAPNERQAEWFRREKSIFFHFGMNTFSDREWGDGTENPSEFNPTSLDCRQWVKTIKDAGFRAAIITAKHHDGFCLWPSKFTEHSVKNSPYKNGNGDIVREFTDACAEFGIKAGIYLSPWDRHEKTWGTPDYDDFYTGQLTELLTNYGKIWEVWWDGAGSTEADYNWERWALTVRKLQPDAVIFGSLGAEPFVESRWVGNEKGFAGDPCWSSIKSESLITETTSELNRGALDGNRFIPAEADVSIRPGWFYHSAQDGKVRDVKNLLKLWFHSCGRNVGLLLNLPPDKRGLVHENDADSLLKFNEVLEKFLSSDLTDKATATADSLRDVSCSAGKILTQDENEFYAAAEGCTTPEITVELDGEKEINAFNLQEVFELGHRVTDYEVSALIDGKWKTIYSGECIGYRSAKYFPTVKTAKVKISITSALYPPVIRRFSLHKIDESLLEEEKLPVSDEEILESCPAVIGKNGNSFDIHFGGIVPFNLICAKAKEGAELNLQLFNGFSFEPCSFETSYADGKITARTKEVIDGCYRIRLDFSNTDDIDKNDLEIYLK